MKRLFLFAIAAIAFGQQPKADLVIIDARPEGTRWAIELQPAKYLKTYSVEASPGRKYFAVSYALCGSPEPLQRYIRFTTSTTKPNGQNVSTFRIAPPIGAEICNITFEALTATQIKELQ